MNWFILTCGFTGHPTGQLVCGECSSKFSYMEMQLVKDKSNLDSENCSICEKSIQYKEAA